MRKILLILILLPAFAYSEIHKEAQICAESGEMCFFWWPKLPEVSGWHQDLGHSYRYRMNTQAPDNFDFSNAESVIYARAEYKDGESITKTLDEFIAFSQKQFASGAPSKVKIQKTGEYYSKGKHKFLSYSFKPESEGNWEQVSYGEETDSDGNEYFIIFVLSSRTKNGYESSLNDYFQFINNYK